MLLLYQLDKHLKVTKRTATLNKKLVPSASKSYRNLIPNSDKRSIYALAPKKVKFLLDGRSRQL